MQNHNNQYVISTRGLNYVHDTYSETGIPNLSPRPFPSVLTTVVTSQLI